ncbi:TadA family conjugal transfer-associated ATPase [Stackebrandtia endophytica]|nr:TadA family conjugal transfer-associated ATPase [Stackebrandtia endophytica]
MSSSLLNAVRRHLVNGGLPVTDEGVATVLRDSEQAPLTGRALWELAGKITNDLSGAGPLQPLLNAPDVTDVLVNGPQQVWADSGDGLKPTGITFPDATVVRNLATRLAAAGGRRLDDAQPYTDVRLADGTRFHAVLPPLAVNGPFLSLRTHRPIGFTLEELCEVGTFTAESADLVKQIIAAKLSFLVSGGTGSGKTTLLRSLIGQADPTERIVVVEDSHELAPQHPHALTLEARHANVDGAGSVGMPDLIRQALRMRPDRIVVGECRGGEVIELLAALNTGHDGSAGTIHANTAADVPARLAALAMPFGVSRPGLLALISAALRVIIHMRRAGRLRVVSEISLLRVDVDQGWVRVVPAWRRDGAGVVGRPQLQRLLDSAVGASDGN